MVKPIEALKLNRQTDSRIRYGDSYRLVNSYRILDEINGLEEDMKKLDNGELKNYTSRFKERLEEGEELDSLLPEAFAVVREAARRIYGDNGESVDGSTRADHEKCMEIFGTEPNGKTLDDAVAKFGRHYDVQLIGGIELHKGNVAEMYTGEGKTLVASLPAYLNALTGEGVHIVTTNDYLARRDAKWMAPLFNFLGLSVGVRYEENGEQNSAETYVPGRTQKNKASKSKRKTAYDCDITYGTVSRFIFDHLNDNSVKTAEEKVQRGYNFALIDEVDHVLLDKANIPHIVAGEEKLTEKEATLLYTADWIARELTGKQKRLTGDKKDTPEDIVNFYTVDDKRNKVCIDEKGFEWMENNLEGLLFGKYDSADIELVGYVANALKAHTLYKSDKQYTMGKVNEISQEEKLVYRIADGLAAAQKKLRGKRNKLYEIEKRTNTIQITKKGIDWIRKNVGEFTNYIESLSENFNNPEDWVKDKINALVDIRDGDKTIDLMNIALRSQVLYNGNMLTDKAVIIDKSTGRPLPNNRWKGGLHEAIEVKEGVYLGNKGTTSGKITTPFFFENYQKIAGMTGTAVEARGEFGEVYGMNVIPIPTNKPVIREDHPDIVCGSKKAKFENIADEIERIHATGRPVLVGTKSIRDSEELAKVLERRGLKRTEREHGQIVTKGEPETGQTLVRMASESYEVIEEGDFEILNAKKQYLASEAQIIEKAGRVGAITIATDMAGRGTDISIEEGSKGLYVIGTDRHFSGRIDNQLKGRAGRQGDPGDSRFYTSIEDDLYKYLPDWIKSKFLWALGENGAVESSFYSKRMISAQKITAENDSHRRKSLFEYDEILDKQRRVLYEIRDKILEKGNVRDYLLGNLENVVSQIVEKSSEEADALASVFTGSVAHYNLPEEFIKNGFSEWYEEKNGYNPENEMIWKEEIRDFLVERQVNSIFGTNVDLKYAENAVKKICEVVEGEYLSAVTKYGDELDSFEQKFLLENMDAYWSNHLDELDRMLPGIKLRKKPIFEYLKESSKNFNTFMNHTSGLAIAMIMQKASVMDEVSKIESTDNIQEYLLGALGNLVSPTIEGTEEKVCLLSEPEITDILEDPSFREWYSLRFTQDNFDAEDVVDDDLANYFLERELNRQFMGDIKVPIYVDDLTGSIVSQLMKVYEKSAEAHGTEVLGNSVKNVIIKSLSENYGAREISRVDKILKAALEGNLLAETSADIDLYHIVDDTYERAKKKSKEVFSAVHDLASAEMYEQMKKSRAEEFDDHPEAQAFYQAAIVRGEESKERLKSADRKVLRAAKDFREAYEGNSVISDSDIRDFLFEQELKRKFHIEVNAETANKHSTVEEVTKELEKIWKERERTIIEENGALFDSLDYLLQPGKVLEEIMRDALKQATFGAIGKKIVPSFLLSLKSLE